MWVFFDDCGVLLFYDCFLSLKYKEFREQYSINIVMFLYQHIMIVQRQMSVIEEEIEEFRLALKQYVESACAQGGCLQ